MIKINELTKTYRDKGRQNIVLNNITFSIPANRIFAIVGLSGCGKSTLVKLLLGLIEPDSGNILIDDISVKDFKRTLNIQPVFQNNYHLIHPLRSIKSVLFEVAAKFNKSKEIIYNEIERLEMSKDILEKKGYQLSGGEQQRIALIKLLIADPNIFVLDEIFSAQDDNSKQIISRLLLELKEQKGKTIIVVSHNLSIVKEIADDAIVLFKGNIVEQGNLKTLFENPSHAYTKLLIKSENYELSREDFKSIDLI